MSLTLESVDELFLHPRWADKLLPEYKGTLLFKEEFFREGNISEFLNLHANIRRQTDEPIGWSDSIFKTPISTDGGNFITCAGISVLDTFVNQKPDSNEKLVQLLPAVSIQNFSPSQTAFMHVFTPRLFDPLTNHQLPESDTHETFTVAVPKGGIAQIALKMCTKDLNPKTGDKPPKGPKGPKGPRIKGPRTESTSQSTDTPDTTEVSSSSPIITTDTVGSESQSSDQSPKSMMHFTLQNDINAFLNPWIPRPRNIIQSVSQFNLVAKSLFSRTNDLAKPNYIPKLN
jgi:hypothetical protein